MGGRLLATTFPDGSTVGTIAQPLSYDAAGRLISIPGFVNRASYDAEEKLTSYESPNGTTTFFGIDAPTGFLNSYATTGPATVNGDGIMILGPYSAAQNYYDTF